MTETETEIVRVLKIVEYTGTREWVEKTIKASLPKEHGFGRSCIIRTAIIGTYPEILRKEKKGSDLIPEKKTRDSLL